MNNALENIGLLDATVVAVLGYAVVFFGLILLMIVIILLGKAFSAAEKNNAATAEIHPTEPAAEEISKPTAPGAAGQLKLHNVDPKTAAMLMAIVADKMGKPINELRFISIKEVN